MGISEHERASEALQQLPALQRGPREKSIFRQNRAKGPNPLSMQKRKRAKGDAAGAQTAEAGSEVPKSKRKRSRKKTSGAAGEAEQAS